MSEAERLADLVERDPLSYSDEAAAELLRLSAELEECQAQLRAAFRRIEEQDAELEKVRKDAERYRWLREVDDDRYEVFKQHTLERLDTAIDAAMKGTP